MTETPSRDALLVAFASFPSIVADAARAAATRPARDGEWTPEQVVRHLIAVETDVHQARLHDLAALEHPRWSWTEPGPWNGLPALGLDRVIERFSGLRATTMAVLHALDAGGWARAGVHDTYGELDVIRLLRTAVDHDQEHLAGLVGS